MLRNMSGDERWLPVPRFEGAYEVSDRGRVRSLDRIGSTGNRLKGKVLTPQKTWNGRLRVDLYHPDGGHKWVTVHRLVLEAFEGPCPEGHECCHWDDDPENNRLENLRWDTRSSNKLDSVRLGNHPNQRKTHCPHGHAYDEKNTIYYRVKKTGRTARQCRTCKDETGRRWKRENRDRVKQHEEDRRQRARNNEKNDA